MAKEINTQKLADFAGMKLHTWLSDDEFNAIYTEFKKFRDADRERRFEAAKHSKPEFGKYVVAKPFNVNGAQLQRGDVIYTSKVKGAAGITYRIQRAKSRQSVIATTSYLNIKDNCEKLF